MNKKSIFVFILVISFITLIFSGCSNKKVDVLEKVKKSGKIIMGTNADFPPYEFHKIENGKDTIEGFDIDIANAIAKKLGVKLEIKDMDFKGLIPALQSGRIDMAIAGMTPTADREKNVDFSELYYNSQQVLVVNDNSEILNLKDLNGKTVAVQIGTTSAEAAKNISGAVLKQLNRVGDEFMDLKNNRVDGIVLEDTVAKAYLKEYPNMKMLNFKELNTEDNGAAVAVAKGNKELVNKINEVINEMKSDGEYEKLIEKWFKQ